MPVVKTNCLWSSCSAAFNSLPQNIIWEPVRNVRNLIWPSSGQLEVACSLSRVYSMKNVPKLHQTSQCLQGVDTTTFWRPSDLVFFWLMPSASCWGNRQFLELIDSAWCPQCIPEITYTCSFLGWLYLVPSPVYVPAPHQMSMITYLQSKQSKAEITLSKPGWHWDVFGPSSLSGSTHEPCCFPNKDCSHP